MNKEQQNLSDTERLRLMAEEQLKLTQEKLEIDAMGIGEKRLLHELQVHQIELEMQNEELHRANEITEKALKKYTMLYDFAPMGYFTLNSKGNICDLNFTGAEVLGERRISLINNQFKLYIAQESLQVFNEFFSKVFEGFSKESCKVKLGYNNRPLREVYMEGVVPDDDQNCLLSVVDISGLK